METRQSHAEIQVGSERSFGLVFGAVFAIIGCFPLISGEPVRLWALALAITFVIAAFVAPRILAPLNRLWFKFGMLLSAVVTPIVMSLLFFVTVTPTAIIMRLLGKDLLQRKIDRSAKSYWIPRKDSVGSMKNQF